MDAQRDRARRWLGQRFARRARTYGWPGFCSRIIRPLNNSYVALRNRTTLLPRVACKFCGWRGYDFLAVDRGQSVVFHAKCPHCGHIELHQLPWQGWKPLLLFFICNSRNRCVRLANRLAPWSRVACSCCGWKGFDFLSIFCQTFLLHHVECPHCQGQERHRMLTLYLDRHHPSIRTAPATVLHISPDPQTRKVLLSNPRHFVVSSDYAVSSVSWVSGPALQTDLQHLALGDASIDLAVCMHVLEHVPDDRKGLEEIARVLKPEGVAYVMVPFMLGWKKTIEFDKPDPLMYGHVRGYSLDDFEQRLAPFDFEKITALSFLSEKEAKRFGIPLDSQVIFRCRNKWTAPGNPFGKVAADKSGGHLS